MQNIFNLVTLWISFQYFPLPCLYSSPWWPYSASRRTVSPIGLFRLRIMESISTTVRLGLLASVVAFLLLTVFHLLYRRSFRLHSILQPQTWIIVLMFLFDSILVILVALRVIEQHNGKSRLAQKHYLLQRLTYLGRYMACYGPP